MKMVKKGPKNIYNLLNFEQFLLILIVTIVGFNFFLLGYANLTSKYKEDFFMFSGAPSAADFNVNYVAAKYLTLGLDIYRDHPEAGLVWKEGYYPYGPIVAYLFVPFTIFSEQLACWIWILCIFIITLFSFLLFSKFFINKYLFWATVLVITAFSYPFKFTLEVGNIDHLIYLFLILMFYFYADKKNDILVGLFLSIAILMKLYPGIFILYFLIKKDWRILFWMSIFSSVLIFLTYSNGAYLSFFNTVIKLINNTYCWTGNHSLMNVLKLIANGMTRYLPLFPKIFYQQFILNIICIIILTLLYIATWIIFRKNRSKTFKSTFLEFSIVLVLMTITTPASHDYNLIILMFATIGLLYYFQSLFVKEKFAKGKDIICAIVFMFFTVYLYAPPVFNFLKLFSNSAPLFGGFLHLLGNKFWPLMAYFFLTRYFLLNEVILLKIKPINFS